MLYARDTVGTCRNRHARISWEASFWYRPALRLYAGRSAAGTSRVLGITVAVLAVLLLHMLQPDARRFTLFLLPFTVALWLHRLLYTAATVFLRSFVIQNHRAFTFVHDHVVIRST